MIQVKDSQGNVRKQFYLSSFQSNPDIRKDIYDQCTEKGNTIWCTCNTDSIQLSIAKREDTIFLKNRPLKGTDHSKNCRLYRHYCGTSEHELGWTKTSSDNENEIYVVNASSTIFSMATAQKVGDEERERIYHRFSYNGGNDVSESKVTLLGLLAKLDMLSWYDYQNSKKHAGIMPSNIWEYLNQVYGTSRKIRFKRKSYTSLQQCWFDGKDDSKGLKFIFMPLDSVEVRRDSDGVIQDAIFILDYYHKKDKKVKQRRVKCCREFFDTLHGILDCGRDEHGNYRALIGGFVERLTYGWRFRSISYLPIISQGLWAESEYEKEVYSRLVAEKILFYKPFESPEFYKNYIPDIYFVRSLTPDKPYIGEIFGIEGNEAYTRKQNEKIALAEGSDEFDLWYWERNAGILEMPSFY